MALISNIGAGIFTKLKYKADSNYTLPTSDSEHQTFIGVGGDFENAIDVTNIREFPSFGKPAKLDQTVIRFLEKFENESM